MIEIIGEPRQATKEEIEKFEKENTKEKRNWRLEMLRKFLKNH